MSDEPRIRSLPFNHRLDILSEEALAKVHAETLTVLERVGVNVRSPHFVEALAREGAVVDRAAQRVRFPPEMVEAAVRRAPRSFSLAARDPALDLPLDGRQGWLSIDGCASEVVDLETGERRPSTRDDLARATRLADALPEIAFVWQPCAARDVPVPVQPLHELRTQFAGTSKHIQLMTAVTGDAARGSVEMARLVAGGDEALRGRPIVSSFQCSISPLVWDEGPLEAAIVFAEAGIPAGFVTMPLTAATAPATPAGALVLTNAEVLSGIVILETLVPGAPTFYGSYTTVMDLRSGGAACGAGPEDLFYQMATAQLARHYGVPSNIGTFASGSKAPDWQAGLENGLSGMASYLGGADMLSGAGLLYSGRVYSLVEMMLETEIFGLIRHLVAGVRFGPDDLAGPVIEAVGPGGHFLAQRHTLAHMRELWMPRSFDRRSWEEWEADGRPEPADRARERVRAILAEHRPAPLEPGLEPELDAVIAAYEHQMGGVVHA
ncbi:MAG: hypothetical protein A2X23_07360 [Chloroflexi bacterium GWC2_73_18]|nr:MAG: hypothetical protein A2X23_07360 [Chloroflexi bacterium GWC2_73_18]